MPWLKVVFPFNEETVQIAFRLSQAAQARHDQAGSPRDFAIFSGPVFDDKDPSASYQAYYFSPVAAQVCGELLTPFSPIPCDKPNPDEFGFSLVFGTLQGLESWDLLK
jgi:hypothetical protein